jgi:hypothetical protein
VIIERRGGLLLLATSRIAVGDGSVGLNAVSEVWFGDGVWRAPINWGDLISRTTLIMGSIATL